MKWALGSLLLLVALVLFVLWGPGPALFLVTLVLLVALRAWLRFAQVDGSEDPFTGRMSRRATVMAGVAAALIVLLAVGAVVLLDRPASYWSAPDPLSTLAAFFLPGLVILVGGGVLLVLGVAQRRRPNEPLFGTLSLHDGMTALVSIVVLLAALALILGGGDSQDSQKWAFGTTGSILGYWLKPSTPAVKRARASHSKRTPHAPPA